MASSKRKFETWEVPVWLLVSCVFVIISVIVAQTWWSITQDKALTLAAANKNSLLNLRILEEHANRVLQDASRATIAAAEELQTKPESVLRDEASVRLILSNQRRDSQFISAISLVDKHGMLWASSLRFPIDPIDLSAHDHIAYLNKSANAYQKELQIGSPYLPKKATQAILPIARNVFLPNGQAIGQVQAEISLSYFQEFYERVAKDAGAKISLYDKEGKLIVQAISHQVAYKAEVDSAVVASVKNSFAENGRFENSVTGADQATSYTYLKMNDFPLVVVFGRDLNTILAEWQKRLEQRLIFAALSILFTLLLAILLYKKVHHLKLSREKLADSERRYRLLFQDAQDGILLIDKTYHFVDGNQNALEMLAVDSKQDLIGLDIEEFSADWRYTQPTVAAKKAEAIRKFVDLAFKGKVQKFEWMAHRRGKDWYSEVNLSRVKIANEPIIFCVMRDISQRKHAERLLQGQNQLLQLIGSSDSLESILIDTCHFVEKNNPHWHCGVQLLSLDQRVFMQTIGHHFPEILRRQLNEAPVCQGNGVWSEAVLEMIPVWTQDIAKSPAMEFIAQRKLLANYAAVGSWPIMGKTGLILGTFTLFTESTAALNNEDLSLISIATDVSSIAIEGKRAEEKAIRFAHYDDVTKLPSRFLFNQYLSKALIYAKAGNASLAVLLLELDRSKAINDSFDLDAADYLLSEFVTRLKQLISEFDTLARVGNDEFMLMLEGNKTTCELARFAEQLLQISQQAFEVQGQEVFVKLSIGVAISPDDGNEAASLMKNAEVAMYRAKYHGENLYQFYDVDTNTQVQRNLTVISELKQAIHHYQLTMHYQPRLNFEDDKVTGVEALLRWNHPQKAVLLPEVFLAMAEEAGLMAEIDMLAFELVCRDIVSFQNAGKTMGKISLNLSAAQFDDAKLVDKLQALMDDCKLTKAAISFDIPVNVLMRNPSHSRQQLLMLKAAGFGLSIDHFGEDAISLSSLQNFPVDSVIIDRAIIQALAKDDGPASIVNAIVAIAKSLGWKVRAVGVETPAQLQVLKAHACDEYQGHVASKALSRQTLLTRLK
ncbi:bifunctional diguanylate cyclase/phosphodiesterase [Undibacterium flavidum]|uniref:EAL domain-containing protein n=1 Tax=Undibacterium flavidum TaxID=2762297 RepID=A0ABR6Y725_9BURK|nr:EAL domain-containing protein [Undibacterium flavidum]MBC3872416.1 EAL domain-containing protein [Undibacterium flavidum]